MSDLVGNPKDRFSHNESHLMFMQLLQNDFSKQRYSTLNATRQNLPENPSVQNFLPSIYTLGQTYKCAVESLFVKEITLKFRNICLYTIFLKYNIDLFKRTIIPCTTVADTNITKLHVENVQAQIGKRKNNKCIVQTHVIQKNIKWIDMQSLTEV